MLCDRQFLQVRPPMKRMTLLFSTISLIILMLSPESRADIAVGIFPAKGDHPKKSEIEMFIKEQLQKCRGISIVADSMMKDIVEVHEKAQAFGSAYHDISKLKTSEYLVIASFDAQMFGIKAVDVNSGTEIFTKSLNLSQGDYNYSLRSACRNLYDSILLHSSSRNEEIPGQAEPYMNLLSKFINSLKSADEESFQFLALYYKGKYQQPVNDDMKSATMAKTFLKAVRPALINSKVSFVIIEEETPWTSIIVVSDRNGKKQKHKVGFIDREDGSFGIGLYELQR